MPPLTSSGLWRYFPSRVRTFPPDLGSLPRKTLLSLFPPPLEMWIFLLRQRTFWDFPYLSSVGFLFFQSPFKMASSSLFSSGEPFPGRCTLFPLARRFSHGASPLIFFLFFEIEPTTLSPPTRCHGRIPVLPPLRAATFECPLPEITTPLSRAPPLCEIFLAYFFPGIPPTDASRYPSSRT